jgi:hypothetical protein
MSWLSVGAIFMFASSAFGCEYIIQDYFHDLSIFKNPVLPMTSASTTGFCTSTGVVYGYNDVYYVEVEVGCGRIGFLSIS